MYNIFCALQAHVRCKCLIFFYITVILHVKFFCFLFVSIMHCLHCYVALYKVYLLCSDFAHKFFVMSCLYSTVSTLVRE